MKKKIIFIFTIIFCSLIFCNKVEAVVDCSLNYEINSFALEKNKLTIDGSASLSCQSGGVNNIRVYLKDDNSNFEADVTKNNANFTATFNLTSVENGKYHLEIQVSNGTTTLNSEVKVSNVKNEDTNTGDVSSNITISSDGDYVLITLSSESEEYDSVCLIEEPDVLDDCSSKKFKYKCDSMKVRTDDGLLSAYVFIDENGEFRMKDYSSVEVTAGRSFAFSLQYIYNLSWKFNRLNCNGVNETECKEILYNVLNGKYFYNVSADTLKDSLKNSVFQADGYDFKNDGNFKNAGSWSCSSSNALADGHLTINCDYKIKDAYINYYTNYVTYFDKSDDNNNYKSLGPYFYLPLDYNEGNFRWNISTGNLSLINVRTNLYNYLSTDYNTWKINTVAETSNKCSVIVNKNFLSSDNSLVYRSVDTNISNENDLKLYYLIEGSNWYNYFYNSSRELDDSKFARIRASFENLHYVTVKLTKKEIEDLLNSYDSNAYTNWGNIDSYGKSKLINDSRYFDIQNVSNIHCSWGEFSNTCDKYS